MSDFFGRRNYLILFATIALSVVILTVYSRESENGPIHMAQRAVMAVVAPIQKTVTTAVSPIKDGWDYLVHFGQLTRENQELRNKLAELKAENTGLKRLKTENARLRKLVDFKEQKDLDTVVARVIGLPSSNWWSSIVIDKGTDNGVKKGMPAVAGRGLVGQVADTSRHSARVLLINDSESGVSAQIKRTGEVGVIRGQPKSSKLTLRYVSRDSTIKKGDLLYSSGLGGIFPKGIYIGRVSSVRQTTYGLYKTVEVLSPVDFVKIQEVMIVKNNKGFDIKGVK